MRYFLHLLTLVFIYSAASAQTPGLTKLDLNSGPGGSFPIYLTPFTAANGGKVIFGANDNTGKGWELYTADGVNKPVLVLDLNSGSNNGIEPGLHRPMAVINGKLYFTGNNNLSGPELFVFNGATMPVLQTNIVSGYEGSTPDDYAVLSNVLYFRARDASFGYELYKFDPATSFTNRLTDINPGADSSINGNVIAFNSKIYFTADSGMGNNELYQYEPFSGVTIMVADIRPGVQGSFPQNLTVINGKLYFTAEDANGRELWVYDGSAAPARVTDVIKGFLSGLPSRDEPIISAMDGKIYINAKDSTSGKNLLFSYDPTSGNVRIAPKANTKITSPQWITPYDGKLYYSAFNDTTGYELWAYDTTNGAKLLLDLTPGPNGSNPEQLTVIGNDLYFIAEENNGAGTEVFRYNYHELSIKNVRFNGNITTYPNPAKDIVHITITLEKPEALQITFTDIMGRQVGQSDITMGTSSLNINTGSWAPGTYYYTVRNAGGARYTVGKILVQ